MSILESLQILRIKHKIKKDYDTIEVVENKIDELKLSLDKIAETKFLDPNEVKKMETNDRKIMSLLRGKNPLEYEKAVEIVKALENVGKTDKREEMVRVFAYLSDMLAHIHIAEELEKRAEVEIVNDFNALSHRKIVPKEKIDAFFRKHSNFFKAKPHKKLAKLIKRYFDARTDREEISTPGPVMKPKEITALQKRLEEYFFSPSCVLQLRKFVTGKIRIQLGLYGSLVTGFSGKESKHRGLPSDLNRVSDVDLALILPPKILEKIPLQGRYLKLKGIYFGPYKIEQASKIGPFYNIFNYLNGLSFAGRTDRIVGIVVADEDFYKANLAEDRHIKMYENMIEI